MVEEISVICKLLNEVRPDGIVRFFKAKQPLNPPRLIDVRLAERVRLVKLRQVAYVYIFEYQLFVVNKVEKWLTVFSNTENKVIFNVFNFILQEIS